MGDAAAATRNRSASCAHGSNLSMQKNSPRELGQCNNCNTIKHFLAYVVKVVLFSVSTSARRRRMSLGIRDSENRPISCFLVCFYSGFNRGEKRTNALELHAVTCRISAVEERRVHDGLVSDDRTTMQAQRRLHIS